MVYYQDGQLFDDAPQGISVELPKCVLIERTGDEFDYGFFQINIASVYIRSGSMIKESLCGNSSPFAKHVFENGDGTRKNAMTWENPFMSIGESIVLYRIDNKSEVDDGIPYVVLKAGEDNYLWFKLDLQTLRNQALDSWLKTHTKEKEQMRLSLVYYNQYKYKRYTRRDKKRYVRKGGWSLYVIKSGKVLLKFCELDNEQLIQILEVIKQEFKIDISEDDASVIAQGMRRLSLDSQEKVTSLSSISQVLCEVQLKLEAYNG